MTSPSEGELDRNDSSSDDRGSGGAASTASRGLADILREAGISTSGAGGRRRRQDDTDTDTDIENAGTDDVRIVQDANTEDDADWDTWNDVGGLSSYLRARTDPAAMGNAMDNAAMDNAATGNAAMDNGDGHSQPPRTDTGPVRALAWVTPGTDRSETSVSRTSPASSPPERSVGAPATGGSPHSTTVPAPEPLPTESGSRTAPSHATRSSSALATAPEDDPDEEDSAVPRTSGVLSWAILGVELLAALGLGVAAWYAFSALWDLLPYVAAFAGSLVVTGLVAVAGALRARTGRNPLGLPTLCILVFAGTVLVVLPAATLIVP
jgi:hypothetical protein